MVDIPTIEPLSFSRGDTVKWTKTLSDFPASVWTLTYEFRGASSHQVVASASDDDHAVSLTPAETGTWNPGAYWWEAYADDGTDRHKAVSGTLEVTTDFATSDAVADHRTHAAKVLDAIEATIEGRASRDQQAYSIAGRSLQLTPVADLLSLRDKYKVEVAAELAKEKVGRGESTSKQVLVRF